MEHFKAETRRMKGAPECMRISRFMHGVNKPDLTKRLNEHVPKTMEEMMITTTAFIRGEAAATSKKKGHVSWKAHDQSKRQNSDKRSDFRGHSREGRGLTGHSTDECMHLKKQIEELVRPGKLSHLIKEIKQGRDHSKTGKKETEVKDKPAAIYMVQSWQRTVKQKVTQSFERVKEIAFPPLAASNGTEGPLVIEAKMGGHMIHRIRMGNCNNPQYNIDTYRMRLGDYIIRGGTLSDKGRTDLCSILKKNLDIFAWQPCDMTGVLRPRTSVKGQILADFLIEMPGKDPQAVPTAETQEEPWTLFIDGSSSSNNEAEYEALVAGLRIAAQMGVKNVHVSVDSKLVANQVLGTYVAKEDNMMKYLEIVKSLVSGFTTFSISQVPRSKKKKANALSKIASTSFAHLSKPVLVEVLKDKSIKENEVATVIEEDGPTWMTQLVDYLKGGVLPGDKKKARKLRLKARQYELIEGVLYRQSFLTPWLRCVRPLQAEYVMREIHEGSCSMHAGPRSVVAKAIRLGYYWPIMHKDARDMIRKCSDCHIHRPITRHPQQPLTPIMAPWPFYKWGIDIAGPFPEGPGKVKFLIVAMDYFTKWIEAKAVVTITGGQELRLNLDMLEERRERVAICEAKSKSKMIKYYNDRVRGVAFKPEIGMHTYRTATVDVVSNDEELHLNLDLLEERRERAAICEAKAKSKMTKYYNARVRVVTFKPGDFVYRSNDASHVVAGGKLGPK
nr:reverse transcriptase domain-containing protein [Tanacetum cinerariifolium]